MGCKTTRRPKIAPHYEPPKAGDYVAGSIFDRDFHVARKGEGTTPWDTSADKRISGCATRRGAEKLAKLLNQARDLGDDWRSINDITPKGGDAEEWARTM